MKHYFEYFFNKDTQNKLTAYYENVSLAQHSEIQKLKTETKLTRLGQMVKFYNNDVVLDIGCSRGFLLQEISPCIKKGVGLDIAKNIIAENNKKIKFPNITFESYDGINIPYNNEFTKITMLDVLEHAFYPDSLMVAIYKSLKENGQLIIGVPFTGWLSELLVKDYHQGHLRYYDPTYLKQYLEKFGFSVGLIRVYNSIPLASLFLRIKILWRILDFIVNLIPTSFFPYFGEIIAIANK